MAKEKIQSIQHLRALAATMVVLHHLAWKAQQSGLDLLHWLHIGDAGVDLFFVISGYIMCRTTTDSKTSPLGFIWARLSRILPLYWLVTTAALAIYLIAPNLINSSGGTTDIIRSYTLTPTDNKYLIRNGWTLSYELYFYTIFFVGLLLGPSFRIPTPPVFILFAVLIGANLTQGNTWLDFLTNPLLLEFSFGIAAFQLLQLRTFTRPHYLLLLLFGVGWITTTNFNGGFGIRIIDYGLPCWMIFVGWTGFDSLNITKKEGGLRGFVELVGDASYSLYLVHPFGLTLATIAIKRSNLIGSNLLFFFSLFGCALILGLLCYRWIEEPLRKRILNTRINHKLASRNS